VFQSLAFIILVLLSLVSFTSCSDRTADQEKFIDTYVDLRIAQDTIRTDSLDIQKLTEEILKKHDLTEEKYKSMFEYYNQNPELWEQFYDAAIARVDSLKKKK
jgi:hypothetical protein